MNAPVITLDANLAAPTFQQIAARMRDAMSSGALAPGARLPSTRGLAAQLGVARGTVDAAYAVLAGEGYIEARGSRGSIVSPHLAARPTPPPQRRMRLDAGAAALEETPSPPFRCGLPALDAFPRKLWAGLTARAVRGLDAAALAYPDPAGYRPLREAIAAYLGIGRGISCNADHVLITAGFQGALSLAMHVLLRPGDPVWVEDPGYFLTRRALEAAGARLVPVRVDQDGMRVSAGVMAAPRARLAVVTPTHQSPLGVALSLQRRLALLAWAAEAGAWVLEDDYDSEFRYTGHPLPAMKSLDRAERVLYAGSFSKTLFPGLRLGYLVLPEELADAFRRASQHLGPGCAVLEQRVVATFMTEGHFARHLRRMRTLYAARRQALAEGLISAFEGKLTLELASGGMHLLARFPQGAPDDCTLVRRAAAVGLAPTALSSLATAHDCGQGLMLGFTNVPEKEAAALAARLARAVLLDQRTGA